MRIANVYGQDKTVSPKKNVLGFLISLMRENKPLTLYNNGDDLRDYMHVIDICRALKIVMDTGELNSIYNIASGNPLPFRNILEMVRDNLGSSSEFIPTETPRFNQLVQPKNVSLNVDKLNSLNFRPSIGLEEGLKIICQ
jgi:dTDP-glucose 4,6-dehydratase